MYTTRRNVLDMCIPALSKVCFSTLSKKPSRNKPQVKVILPGWVVVKVPRDGDIRGSGSDDRLGGGGELYNAC